MRFVDGKAHLSRDRCVPIMSLIYFWDLGRIFQVAVKCHAADSEHNGQFADVATGLFPACNKGILIMLPGFFNAVFPRQLDMAGVDDTACRMEEGLFNDSLELLDIAGPVAAVEKFHGLVGKRLCRHAVTGRHFRKDMVGNDFHIFHPLPQGRYPDDGANDQFIEALGKEAFIGQTFQVGVTGRNDADIEFPANACLLVENTVFQSISQDIAQLRREFFHFIKEKRSPIGQFQTAGCQMARTIGLAKNSSSSSSSGPS